MRPTPAASEALDGDRLREGRGEPWHLVVEPAREDEQESVPREPGRQVLEELVRARVDPVHVLDHQDDGLRLTGAEEHRPKDVERAFLELGAG